MTLYAIWGVRPIELRLSTDAHLVTVGSYVNVGASFRDTEASNAIVLKYTFNRDAFEFASYLTPDGVVVVNREFGDGFANITLMIPDYNATDIGTLQLRTLDGVGTVREFVTLEAEIVIRDGDLNKKVDTADASVSFRAVGSGENPTDPEKPWTGVKGDTNFDGVVDIIDLSNIIDWFGIEYGNPDWEDFYINFDFNNNGMIDISDISFVAQLI